MIINNLIHESKNGSRDTRINSLVSIDNPVKNETSICSSIIDFFGF